MVRSGQNKQTPAFQAKAGHELELPASRLLDRLIFLSDGVFAIAMTLGSALLALGPKYFSFGVSFPGNRLLLD